MRPQQRCLLVSLYLALTSPGAAQIPDPNVSRITTPEQNGAQSKATEDPASNNTPSLELLEFLGEFETSDGQWHDPINDIEALEQARPEAGVRQ